MNPELLATLRKWQASDDPVERAHAEWRLTQPDQVEQLEPTESDAARAVRLIQENPPENTMGKPCGACSDR